MLSFTKEVKIVPVEAAVAASTATTVGAIVDTQGFDAACFIYKLGTVVDGAAITLKVYQGSDAAVGDVAELEGASATIATAASDSNKYLVVDVIKPQERYLRPTIVTATQNVTINDGTCYLYNPAVIPVIQPATVEDDTLVVSPNEA